MARIFATFQEGMNKNQILLYQSSYEDIVKGEHHTGGHSEAQSHFHVVKQAIENPDQINQDADYKNRKCYYVKFPGDEVYGEQFMKVVIKERRLLGRMVVVTAYFTSHIKTNETKIWSKI